MMNVHVSVHVCVWFISHSFGVVGETFKLMLIFYFFSIYCFCREPQKNLYGGTPEMFTSGCQSRSHMGLLESLWLSCFDLVFKISLHVFIFNDEHFN